MEPSPRSRTVKDASLAGPDRRPISAMSGHANSARSPTFRVCAGSPLSGARPISQTDPKRTYRAFLVRPIHTALETRK